MLNNRLRAPVLGAALILATLGTGCDKLNLAINGEQPPNPALVPEATPAPLAAPTPAPAVAAEQKLELPVTLPVLDAFLYDESFKKSLADMGLTPAQIEDITRISREETSKLRETSAESSTTTPEEAATVAQSRIAEAIGPEKTAQVFDLIRQRWSGDAAPTADAPPEPMASADLLPPLAEPPTGGPTPAQATLSPATASKDKVAVTESAPPPAAPSTATTNAMAAPISRYASSAFPTDTRIVVNSAAYRMDLFEKGRLIKSYKIGIGYPEFPLPTGIRLAQTIIFNPTWTPPDEPWVEGSDKVKAGQTVAAGSKLNPLGPIKIPIGLPSLIHGGKTEAKLGGFASHGCVGLTNAQVMDLAPTLAMMAGKMLDAKEVKGYLAKPTQTENYALGRDIPVELRYQTIVAEDGKLHIYRDVYGRNLNTEDNLRRVLAYYGIPLEKLSATERQQAMTALQQMAAGPNGTPEATATPTPKTKTTKETITRTVKGKRDVIIPVAALKGKGYPTLVRSILVGKKPATTATPSPKK